jgi:hypothetical protein
MEGRTSSTLRGQPATPQCQTPAQTPQWVKVDPSVKTNFCPQ